MSITSKISMVTAAFIVAAASALPVAAHVTVSPKTAVAGERVTFNVSAPNEKDISFNQIRLVIPESIESVTPTVAPGWDIKTEKDGERTTEVTWSGGSVPSGQRVDFSVRTQVPEGVEKLEWKAYQTYADGTEVAWDQAEEPAGGHGDDEKQAGPFSVTAVSAADTSETDTVTPASDTATDIAPLAISILALAVAVFSVLRSSKR